MFRMGKDSNIHEKLYDLIMCHLQRYKNENDQINGIPFSYFMSYVSGADCLYKTLGRRSKPYRQS